MFIEAYRQTGPVTFLDSHGAAWEVCDSEAWGAVAFGPCGIAREVLAPAPETVRREERDGWVYLVPVGEPPSVPRTMREALERAPADARGWLWREPGGKWICRFPNGRGAIVLSAGSYPLWGTWIGEDDGAVLTIDHTGVHGGDCYAESGDLISKGGK